MQIEQVSYRVCSWISPMHDSTKHSLSCIFRHFFVRKSWWYEVLCKPGKARRGLCIKSGRNWYWRFIEISNMVHLWSGHVLSDNIFWSVPRLRYFLQNSLLPWYMVKKLSHKVFAGCTYSSRCYFEVPEIRSNRLGRLRRTAGIALYNQVWQVHSDILNCRDWSGYIILLHSLLLRNNQ